MEVLNKGAHKGEHREVEKGKGREEFGKDGNERARALITAA